MLLYLALILLTPPRLHLTQAQEFHLAAYKMHSSRTSSMPDLKFGKYLIQLVKLEPSQKLLGQNIFLQYLKVQ